MLAWLNREKKMKHLKMLSLAAVAAAALMAFVGASSASATVLTSPKGTNLPSGTVIQAKAEGTSTITTSFLNITCSSSEVAGKSTNESGATVNVNVETLTFGGCNCEVKVLKRGTLSIAVSGSGPNGSVSSSGAEVTAQCNTIFGAIHCIYVTSNTGPITFTGSSSLGGGTARIDVTVGFPRLSTNFLCDEESVWHVQFSITNPDFLDIG